MYCRRCEIDYFGGSICARCGGTLERGEVRFSRMGQPLFLRGAPPISGPDPSRRAARAEKEPGRSEGLLVRLGHKLIESVFACALFSVVLRVGTFMFKIVDSLMATGGDIREGISFLAEMKREISGYEIWFWVLIAVLVFRFRHNPR